MRPLAASGAWPGAAAAPIIAAVSPQAYIRSLFEPRERVALVAIPRGPGAAELKVEQRVFSAAKAASPRVQAWLRHLNAKRYDLFLSMQPIRPGAWGRTKKAIGEVKRVYLDIDEDGEAALARLRADASKGRLPPPTRVVRSSPGRYQVIWSVPKGSLGHDEAEALMRGMADRYGADPAAVDVSRVLRLPGYRSWKRDGFPCSVAGGTGRDARADEFPEDLRVARPRPGPAPARARRQGRSLHPAGGGDTSRSGQDWAWTRERLRRGADPVALESELAARRHDKPRPADYARRTVRRARESLGPRQGGPSRWRDGPSR